MRTHLCIVCLFLLNLSILRGDYFVESSPELQSTCNLFLQSQPKLPGKNMADELRRHLVEKGYTFAQVSYEVKGYKSVLVVQEGKLGKATFSGNSHLSDRGISQYLNWSEGDSFNFGTFQKNAANLNRRKFVEVDSKLAPVRSDSGEISVNAEFSVEDSTPIAGSINLKSNTGFKNQDSNDYRSTVNLEYWEPFFDTDRIGASISSDPSSPSDLLSASLNYSFGPKEYSQILFGGYFESQSSIETDSSSPLSSILGLLAPSGRGYHLGYQGYYDLKNLYVNDLGLVYGYTYLDVYTKPFADSAEAQLSLHLPRLGLRGSFQNPNPFGVGNNFWSITATHDFSSTEQAQLTNQTDPADSGFYYIDFHLSSYQPIFVNSLQMGGILARLNGRFTNEKIPNLVKYRTGGGFQSSSGVRGYSESEEQGDRGLSLSLEYRYKEMEARFASTVLKLQPFVFYDLGYVENLSYSSSGQSYPKTTADLQSIGIGTVGNIFTDIDFLLSAGLPIVEGSKTDNWEPSIHFDLTWKF